LPETELAPIDIEFPVQIAEFEITDAVGNGFTVIVTEFDLLQPVAVVVSTFV